MASDLPLAPGGPTIHLTRQPIQAVAGDLVGYDLRFSAGPPDPTAAASPDETPEPGQVIDPFGPVVRGIVSTLIEYPVPGLTGDGQSMVGLPRPFIVGDLPVPFDPAAALIRTSVGADGDPDGVTALAGLVAAGHQIALDGFVATSGTEPSLGPARWALVDVRDLTLDQVRLTLAAVLAAGVQPVAIGAADQQQRDRCADLGFELFLGRPAVAPLGTGLIGPQQTAALRLLGELSDPLASVDELAAVIATDPALSFELLRVANSAAYGYGRTISAIRDAVVIVGQARLRAWVALVALSPSPQPPDLLTAAVINARMCEQLAARTHLGPPGAGFVVGLLDGLAEALGLAVQQLTDALPRLSRELVDALSGEDTSLRCLLDATRCYQLNDLAGLARTRIGHPVATRAYLDALTWSVQTTRAVTEPHHDAAADRA